MATMASADSTKTVETSSVDFGDLLIHAPHDVTRAIYAYGATLIEECREDKPAKFYIQISDESERRDRLSNGTGTPADQQYVHKLDWARSVMLENERIRQFLRTSDWLLWPPKEEIHEMTELCRAELEALTPPDFQSSRNLKEALVMVMNELANPGLHLLHEHQLGNSLVTYHPASSLPSSDTQQQVVGEATTTLIRQNRCKRDRDTSDVDGPQRLWTLSTYAALQSTSEIMRLPLTAVVQERAAALLESGSAQKLTWKQCVMLHSKATHAALFYTVQELMGQLYISEENVVARLEESGHLGRRTRLRCGIYLTVIELPEIYVISRVHGLPVTVTAQERNAFEMMVQMGWEECESQGQLMITSSGKSLKTEVANRCSSPLNALSGATLDDMIHVEEVGVLCEGVTLRRARMRHNVFGVLHGPRVVEGAKPDNTAKAPLHAIVSMRDIQDNLSGVSRTRTQPRSEVASRATGAVVTGEVMRSQLNSAVIGILSEEPLAKDALKAHGRLTTWAKHPEFEALIRDALKQHAKYKGKRYVLKDTQ